MSRNKKIVAIVTLVLGFVLLTVGVSSALMNYNRIGSNHQVVLGDIWMSYEETTALTIEDAVPGSDYSNYFEFQISGKNTYTKKDIYYDFSLVRGDLPEGKTEDNRIPDKYLKFKLVSVDDSNQETVIFTDETYESLENQRIHVETIKKNTENKINRKYRLYMTIDNSLEIGNLETAVFTLDEWASAFASVKLNVTGDFVEKIVVTSTDVNCFKTSTLSDGTLEITDYYKYGKYDYNTSSYNENPFCTSDVVIPNKIDGVDVTKIGTSSFNWMQLTSVEIPNSVTMIGDYAFYNNYLTNVKIPNSVTTIGDSTFGWNELTSVEIPDSVSQIGDSAFKDNNLVNIEIPDSVTRIGSFAFQDNELTNIEIPDSVVYIGNAAFNGNDLPDTAATIYARKDENADGISEIDTATIVSYGGITKDIEIPNSVTRISDYAFYSNNITNVIIPNGVTYIGEYAFSSNNLTSIDIPTGITKLNYHVFAYNNLSNVTIPENIIEIGDSAFSNNCLLNVEIPDSVITIGVEAFYHNQLTNITIPKSVSSLSPSSFSSNQLTNIIFEENSLLTEIPQWAFYNNYLTNVKIPDSIISIGYAAFSYNNLNSVTIGTSVETIEEKAFGTHEMYYGGSSRITQVVNKSGRSFNWDSVFNLTSSDGNSTFSEGTYRFYYNGEYNEIIIGANLVTPTPASCFTINQGVMDSSGVEVIMIMDYDASCGSDVAIPSYINGVPVVSTAFYSFENKGLTSVVIPNTIKRIAERTFQGNNLRTVVIPDSVTTIEYKAFANNYLEKVYLGNSIQTIENSAFPTHSSEYAGSNMITTVVNTSGNAFNWSNIFGISSNDGNTTFETGDFNFYYNGYQTIWISDYDLGDAT